MGAYTGGKYPIMAYFPLVFSDRTLKAMILNKGGIVSLKSAINSQGAGKCSKELEVCYNFGRKMF